MAKRKRKESMTGLGVGLIGGTVAIGAMPNVSGLASESTIKSSAIEGMGKASTVLPTMGKAYGAGMVIDVVGKLNKKSKKLTRRSL